MKPVAILDDAVRDAIDAAHRYALADWVCRAVHACPHADIDRLWLAAFRVTNMARESVNLPPLEWPP